MDFVVSEVCFISRIIVDLIYFFSLSTEIL